MHAARRRRTSSVDNVPSYRLGERASRSTSPAIGAVHRRRRLGRQLVLPRQRSRRAARAGERGAADRRHAGASARRWRAQGITGDDGAEIDHVELFGPPHAPAPTAATSCSARARPTTARPAAPAPAPSSPAWPPTASSREGEVWRQESIVGSVFEASYRRQGDRRHPDHHGPRLRHCGGDAASSMTTRSVRAGGSGDEARPTSSSSARASSALLRARTPWRRVARDRAGRARAAAGATAAGMGHLVVMDDSEPSLSFAATLSGYGPNCGPRHWPRVEWHACGTLWVADGERRIG